MIRSWFELNLTDGHSSLPGAASKDENLLIISIHLFINVDSFDEANNVFLWIKTAGSHSE